MLKRLIIRADASPNMGTGHIMRCIALAQAGISAGLDVQLVSHCPVDWLRERVRTEGVPFVKLSGPPPKEERPENLLEFLDRFGYATANSGLVLDGYHFSSACQHEVMRSGYPLLLVDDYNHLPLYHCNILLNPNIEPAADCYKGNIGKKLLGAQYVLLRKDFLISRPAKIPLNVPERLLITLGGGNFINVLEKIASSLPADILKTCSISVLRGAMPYEKIIQAFERRGAPVQIFEAVTHMADLLYNTDICITAGGGTCWELCKLKIPFLTVPLAANQEAGVHFMAEQGIAPVYSSRALQFFFKPGFLADYTQKWQVEHIASQGAAGVIQEFSKHS